jgi:hypothetical protein
MTVPKIASRDFDDASRDTSQSAILAAITGAKPPLSYTATPYKWTDPRKIPPRDWLYGKLWLRRSTAVIVAPGGAGKTAMLVGHALALATGKPIMGQTVWEGPRRVWVWNLEDGSDELARLVQAAALHHGLVEADFEGRLFIDSGLDGQNFKLAEVDRSSGAHIVKPVAEALIAELRSRKIDVLMLDPFVSTHSVNENDNMEIDLVIKEWSRIAVAANCVVVLAHHTSKAAKDEVTVNGSRGAVSLTNGARSVLTLNGMTDAQADSWGIEKADRRRYVSAYDDKNNRAPAAGSRDWFYMESVPLGNGGMAAGDEIQVMVPWQPPVEVAAMSDEELDRAQRVVSQGEFKANEQAKDWAGLAVAEALGLDMAATGTKLRVKAMLRQATRDGHFQIIHRRDKTGNKRPYLVVGKWRKEPSPQPAGVVGSGGDI